MGGFYDDKKQKQEEGKRRRSLDIKAETPEEKKQRIEQFVTALTKHEGKRKDVSLISKKDMVRFIFLFDHVSCVDSTTNDVISCTVGN